MARECPKCGLVNPPEVVRCDCGYDFVVKQGHSQPPTYLLLACLTLLLSLPVSATAFYQVMMTLGCVFAVVAPAFMLPLSMLALVYSLQVRPRFIGGNLVDERRASAMACSLCLAGFALNTLFACLLLATFFGAVRLEPVNAGGHLPDQSRTRTRSLPSSG